MPFTSSALPGLVVAIPTFPLLRMRIASVAPLLPVWKMMSAFVVPTPEVERNVSVDVVPVPPITNGAVADVVIVGVAIVGEVPNTKAPLPVSSVIADARLAEVDVPKNVAMPVAKLVIPVPPLATGRVPVTPVDNGKPVAFVSTAADGVPSAGVVNVGDVVIATLPDPDTVYSPTTPALLYSTRVVVPLVIADEPIVNPAAATLGAAQVPSPRQKVLEDALVPLFRFVTGRLPVTCDDNETALVVQSTAVPPTFARQKFDEVNVPTCGSVSLAGIFDAMLTQLVPSQYCMVA